MRGASSSSFHARELVQTEPLTTLLALTQIGVAASHPVMREQVERVEFTSNVLESRVSGKKKKGGSFLLPHTILCHVHCASGAVFVLRSCVRGTLLEFNERLQDQPSLLQDKVRSPSLTACSLGCMDADAVLHA